MADISAIKLPNNTTYTIKDNNALPLTGGSVTGPVSFGDSVSIDEATIGDLVVNGSGSFTNNLQANTINGVAVGNSPKFTDTNTTYSAGTGLSLSSTTFNHTNSVTAQTTQAVYPIKIDAQGHISAYGSAVTIPTVPSNIVNTITTTAGAHTTISNQKGNVSFNVPTKTSHLTNDSGFISNIKTINNTSLVGSGNVAVQPTLVSGTNIKTINNESILGSGNISIINTRGTPASGGTILSLVNTGDMYTWDNKTQVQIIRW